MAAAMHSNANISPGAEFYASENSYIFSLVLPQLYNGTKIAR